MLMMLILPLSPISIFHSYQLALLIIHNICVHNNRRILCMLDVYIMIVVKMGYEKKGMEKKKIMSIAPGMKNDGFKE